MEIDRLMSKSDGMVPNHPSFPLLLYHNAFVRDSGVAEPAEAIETFRCNGCHGAWINGVFDHRHYHARSHQVLSNLGPGVEVQFGGAAGPIIGFEPGTAVVIPAGCGHCRLSSGDGLVIAGAYPEEQENWDLKRANTPK